MALPIIASAMSHGFDAIRRTPHPQPFGMTRVGSALLRLGVSILAPLRSFKKRLGEIIVWPLSRHIKRRNRLFELNFHCSLFLQMSF
jgi:hypothetical protein